MKDLLLPVAFAAFAFADALAGLPLGELGVAGLALLVALAALRFAETALRLREQRRSMRPRKDEDDGQGKA